MMYILSLVTLATPLLTCTLGSNYIGVINYVVHANFSEYTACWLISASRAVEVVASREIDPQIVPADFSPSDGGAGEGRKVCCSWAQD